MRFEGALGAIRFLTPNPPTRGPGLDAEGPGSLNSSQRPTKPSWANMRPAA